MKTLDFRRASARIALVVLFAVCPVAFADENDEVAKLYQQGNLDKALEQADAYLALKPKDPQMRFHKGLILTEQQKIPDAIKVFSSLSEDYPNLPEPYNNLAVLYASQGLYEKARGALEAAIRTHPSYSIAHENLGDIYAKLASEAYGKALQLDQSNAAAQTKLAMIKDLFIGKSGAIRTASAATTAPAPPASAATRSAAATMPSPPRSVAPMASSAAPSAAPATPLASVHAAPGKAPQKLAEKKTEKVEKSAPGKIAAVETHSPEKKTAVPDESDEIIKTVNAWAKAWSDKNMAAYFAFYASDFQTPRGVKRTAWERTRRDRIIKPKSIQVEITHPKVTLINPARARISFRQLYHSDAFKHDSSKTLEMVKTDGKWQIRQERSGK
ncbi:Tetratricopeptide repeat-containing protein [Nitrosospira multiformis]|uniref:Tetratricopeptide repeat-containing protein n=1 Tax=Nitrosospira multiformis TaxID=1231 RepID=A0A1H9Z6N9_9PROT|nr:nuclear transport factor 2 family protein [Nitrosospira multiformis]SES77013.1 Tetratricopeptide repeat-containing protein [Nitrosospira multiformis]